ncbi:MAG: hypothetical protein L0271_04265 [Gemmatimonadetes bacterium]|nr:hypothetical protein [Gemmatimonadota bacterium]
MDSTTMARDVAFLRDAVERTARAPAGIYFLWAAIVAVGGAVLDRRPDWAQAFWLVAIAVGVAGSALIGWRQSVRTGVRSRLGMRPLAHWVGVSVVVLGVVAIANRGGAQSAVLGSMAMMIVALGYYLAAVHGDGSAWAPAVITLAAGILLIVFPSSWLIVGVVCGLGLAGVGVVSLMRGPKAHG